MASKLLLAFLACMMAAGLAGCTSKGADAAVKFDGSGNGVDADTAEDCGGDGTLVGTGNVDEGEVTVRVVSAGDEIFEETYTSDIAIDGRALEGDSGDWTIQATRSGDELLSDFDGEYTFRLDC